MSYKMFQEGADLQNLPAQQHGDSTLMKADKAWDVCVVKDRLFASVHTGCDRSRIHEYTVHGEFVRAIHSEHFCEPNMFAMQC